ncbi:unnamed protein product [Colias eurytheme]|nr:unnamed protein product [Colias eurytheme]
MLKLCLSIILAAFLQNVQCRPSDTSANATATDHSNLFVGNTTSSNDTRMDSFVSQLGNVEKQIDETLAAISPYLNFMFDTDSDSNSDDDDDCVDQMIIQLVPQYITPKEAKEIEDEAEEIKEQSEQASLSKDESSSSNSSSDDDELDDLSDSSESSEEFDDDSDDEEEELPVDDEYYPKYRIYDTRPICKYLIKTSFTCIAFSFIFRNIHLYFRILLSSLFDVSDVKLN